MNVYFYMIEWEPLPTSGTFRFCFTFWTSLNTKEPYRMETQRGQEPHLTCVPGFCMASVVDKWGLCHHYWTVMFLHKGLPVTHDALSFSPWLFQSELEGKDCLIPAASNNLSFIVSLDKLHRGGFVFLLPPCISDRVGKTHKWTS